MNREQSRLFELMKEFDSFCSTNSIKYFLSGEALMYGVCCGRMEPRPCYASVIMDAENCRKFIDAFEAGYAENREIEYWGNSDTYPDYTVRYIASDTTAFNIFDYQNYKCHGMFIEIQILRGENGKKVTRHNLALEKGIMLNSYNETARLTKVKSMHDRKSDGYFKAMSMMKGQAGLRKYLFNFFMTECAKPKSLGKGLGGLYTFINRSRKIKDVSSFYFANADQCTIEGYNFPVPSNARILIKKMFNKRYKPDASGDHVEDNFRYIENCIVDPDYPYADALENMNMSKEDFQEIRRSKERIEEINRLNNDNNTVVREDWRTVQQTDARFRMWKHYMPLKDEILKLDAARDWRGLEMIFWEYTEELNSMRSIGRSFSFDNELLDVYIRLLIHKGLFDEADRIIRQMPKSHLQKIELAVAE